MDRQTVSAYDSRSAEYAADWESQPAATDLYGLLGRYLIPAGKSIDVGCGSGREVAWLAANGYDASGVDASAGLIAQARALHPGLSFSEATLPALAAVEQGGYDNVVCETVIMHLDPSEVGAAAKALKALLKPFGILYLSWRVTRGASQRDKAGRLYAAFDKQLVMDGLGGSRDTTVLYDEEEVSASSGKVIHRLIVENGA